MDQTRKKAKRVPSYYNYGTKYRLQQAKQFIALAMGEMDETGNEKSEILDWAMHDLKEASRRIDLWCNYYDNGVSEYEDLQIIRCDNGVGEWEINPTGETFDTRREEEQRLSELKEGEK